MIGCPKTILIGGTGRSGTTIVADCVAQHPQVSGIPESRFLVDPGGLVPFFKTCISGSPFSIRRELMHLKQVLKDVSKVTTADKLQSKFDSTLKLNRRLSPAYAGVDMRAVCPDFDSLVGQFLEALDVWSGKGAYVGQSRFEKRELSFFTGTEEDLLLAIQRFLSEIANSLIERKPRAEFFLEKNTWNILYLDTLQQFYPDSKFIHVVRDPRDVVSSFMDQTWMPDDPIDCAKVLRNLMSRWWKIRACCPHDSFLEVRLEDLASDTEGIRNRLLKFAGLDETPEIFSKLQPKRANSDRWKRNIEPSVEGEVTEILSDIISEYDY